MITSKFSVIWRTWFSGPRSLKIFKICVHPCSWLGSGFASNRELFSCEKALTVCVSSSSRGTCFCRTEKNLGEMDRGRRAMPVRRLSRVDSWSSAPLPPSRRSLRPAFRRSLHISITPISIRYRSLSTTVARLPGVVSASTLMRGAACLLSAPIYRPWLICLSAPLFSWSLNIRASGCASIRSLTSLSDRPVASQICAIRWWDRCLLTLRYDKMHAPFRRSLYALAEAFGRNAMQPTVTRMHTKTASSAVSESWRAGTSLERGPAP